MPRRIVITRPGLTLGKPGTILTAEQTGMDDDELDAFIEARHGHEVFDADDELAPEATTLDAPDEPEGAPAETSSPPAGDVG